MKKYFAYMLVLLSVFAANTVSAAVQFSEAEYIVEKSERIDENVYATASRIVFSGTATEDVVLIGGDVIFDGNVEGDLIVIAKQALINGSVRGDSRVVAGNVSISDSITGDSVVLAGESHILDTSSVGGDALLFGGTVDTNGNFSGETSIVAGRTILAGDFNDEVTISTQDISIGEVTLKEGNSINYYAPREAAYTGNEENLALNYNQTSSWKENGIIKHSFLIFISFWTVLRFVTTMIIIFFFTYGFRQLTRSIAIQSTEHPWKSIVYGLVVLVGVPVAAILLLISLVGMPIGILLGLVYVMLFVVRYALMSIVVGAFIKRTTGWDASDGIVNFWYAVIGLVILTIVQFIPYLDNIVSILVTLLAFGAVATVITKPLSIKRR